MIAVLAIVVPAVSSIIVAIIAALSNQKIKKIEQTISEDKARTAETSMLLGIGQVTLVNECRRYIQEDYISKDDFEALQDHMYKPYKALGGNSTGDLWFERVKTMYAKELK